MESSQFLGSAEECQSCESGWTTYIASMIQDDDDEDGYYDQKDDSHNYGHVRHHVDSDDSMASDASSGPSYREWPSGNGEHGYGRGRGHGMSLFSYGDTGERDGDNYNEEAKKPMEKQRSSERKAKGEEKAGFMGKRDYTSSQSGSKGRRSTWVGKKKY